MKWLCILALASTTVVAQPYPTKPVRVIVPFPPGGTADLLSRATAQKLAASLGQQFIVESRAGAGGNVGAEFVYRAEPDGYTLLATPPHILTVNPLLYPLAFDPTRFVPVSIIAAYPNVLLATPKLAASTLDELIAQAKQNPGRLNIASQGSGTISHLSAELLKSMASINLTHVPYKGTAPAMTDLLGGQVDLLFDNLITAMPHVKAGKLKLLGVGGAKRVPAFPDVPAIAERLPGFHSESLDGLRRAAGHADGDRDQAIRGNRARGARARLPEAPHRDAGRPGRQHAARDGRGGAPGDGALEQGDPRSEDHDPVERCSDGPGSRSWSIAWPNWRSASSKPRLRCRSL